MVAPVLHFEVWRYNVVRNRGGLSLVQTGVAFRRVSAGSFSC